MIVSEVLPGRSSLLDCVLLLRKYRTLSRNIMTVDIYSTVNRIGMYLYLRVIKNVSVVLSNVIPLETVIIILPFR